MYLFVTQFSSGTASRSFLERCTLTNKAVGTYDGTKPPQTGQGPDPRSLWSFVGNPSALEPEIEYILRVA